MAKTKKAEALELAPRKRTLREEIWRHRVLYLYLLPCVISLLVFSYYPMYGATLAFKNYRYDLGILRSPWVGLRNFREFFTSYMFWETTRNTVVISYLKTLFCWPAPIFLALLLNELRFSKFKRIVQTFSYLPAFVSWAVVANIMVLILSPYGGIVNNIRQYMGLNARFFMGEKNFFYPLLLISHNWKNVGWGTIIYLSALSSVNPELYEAAYMDGAGKLKCVWHITLPSIKTTIGILFIFEMGSVFNSGYEQVLLLQQPANMEISEVMDTYVLRMAFSRGRFELATAIGLFRSVISFAVLWLANQFSKKFLEVGIF